MNIDFRDTRHLEMLSAIAFISGVIFIFFGCFHPWIFSTYFEHVESVRTYVFIVGGIILLFIGYSLHVVSEFIKSLKKNINDLNDDTKK